MMNDTFQNLYKTHYNRVYYAALKMTKDPSLAEDVLQETFIKAYDKLGEVKEEGKVGAWLATIAKRKAIDCLRKNKRLVSLPVEELPFTDYEVVEGVVELKLEIEETFHKISVLPKKLRVVLKMSCLEGLQEKEIAKRLGISSSCVKSRLYRARMTMKKRDIIA